MFDCPVVFIVMTRFGASASAGTLQSDYRIGDAVKFCDTSGRQYVRIGLVRYHVDGRAGHVIRNSLRVCTDGARASSAEVIAPITDDAGNASPVIVCCYKTRVCPVLRKRKRL